MADILQIPECDPFFPEEVSREPGCQHLSRCFSCGVCTASCPVSRVQPDFSPSRIIRHIHHGRRRELLASGSLWYCLRCATCSFQCPQDVRFADIMGGLRNMAVQAGIVSPDCAALLEKAEHLVLDLRLKLIDVLLSRPAASGDLQTLLQQALAELSKSSEQD